MKRKFTIVMLAFLVSTLMIPINIKAANTESDFISDYVNIIQSALDDIVVFSAFSGISGEDIDDLELMLFFEPFLEPIHEIVHRMVLDIHSNRDSDVFLTIDNVFQHDIFENIQITITVSDYEISSTLSHSVTLDNLGFVFDNIEDDQDNPNLIDAFNMYNKSKSGITNVFDLIHPSIISGRGLGTIRYLTRDDGMHIMDLDSRRFTGSVLDSRLLSSVELAHYTFHSNITANPWFQFIFSAIDHTNMRRGHTITITSTW